LHALQQTRRDLTVQSREFLENLPPFRVCEDRVLLIHGSVADVCEYMFTERQVQQCFHTLRERFPAVRLCMFGHTHRPTIVRVSGGQANQRTPHSEEALDITGDTTYFVNPGAVDGARKESRQPTAEFGVFDSSASRFRFVQLPYDHRASERTARKLGYRVSVPDQLRRFSKAALRRAKSVAQR
jgi:predicted phosphodiesterase